MEILEEPKHHNDSLAPKTMQRFGFFFRQSSGIFVQRIESIICMGWIQFAFIANSDPPHSSQMTRAKLNKKDIKPETEIERDSKQKKCTKKRPRKICGKWSVCSMFSKRNSFIDVIFSHICNNSLGRLERHVEMCNGVDDSPTNLLCMIIKAVIYTIISSFITSHCVKRRHIHSVFCCGCHRRCCCYCCCKSK